MTTLTSDQLLSEITAELSELPHAQRVADVRAYQQMLSEPQAMERGKCVRAEPVAPSTNRACPVP